MKQNNKNGFSKFVSYFYNPIVWVIVGTTFLTILAFLVKNIYINPAKAEIQEKLDVVNDKIKDMQYVIDANTKEINKHNEWCEKHLSKYLSERPTRNELTPKLESMSTDIKDLKAAHLRTDEKMDKNLNEIKTLIIEKMK